MNKPQELYQRVRKYATDARDPFSYDQDAALGVKCRYRGPNDTKCAIGCVLPDGLYDPDMEGNGIDGLLDGCWPDVTWFFDGVDRNMLVEFQSAHDTIAPSYEVADLEDTKELLRELYLLRLDNIARSYGLTVSGYAPTDSQHSQHPFFPDWTFDRESSIDPNGEYQPCPYCGNAGEHDVNCVVWDALAPE